jgi:hypothetical protein
MSAGAVEFVIIAPSVPKLQRRPSRRRGNVREPCRQEADAPLPAPAGPSGIERLLARLQTGLVLGARRPWGDFLSRRPEPPPSFRRSAPQFARL